MGRVSTCRIWGEQYEATGYTVPYPSQVIVEESHRAGGSYKAGGNTKLYLDQLNDNERARLTTWLVSQRLLGFDHPILTSEVIQSTRYGHPLPIHERANRLLRFFVTHSELVGEKVRVGDEGEYNDDGDWVPATSHNLWKAMAWSESVDSTEVGYCVAYLEKMGWITTLEYVGGEFAADVVVTIEGYGRIADMDTNVDSSQVFVAMWFDESMGKAYEEGFELGIKDSGFTPLRIDRKEHANRIEDEIIAEIRRSRFVVADFTQGTDGARGGVYYEAGFAHGLGLPVIFTCNIKSEKILHFDTSHYNHIFWTTTQELREKLKNRILAVVGEGPVQHRSQ